MLHGDLDLECATGSLREGRVGDGSRLIRCWELASNRWGKQFESYGIWLMCHDPPAREASYGHLHTISITTMRRSRGIPALLALALWLVGRCLLRFRARLLRTAGIGIALGFICFCSAVIIAVMLAGYEEVNPCDSEVLAMFLAVVSCGYVALGETAGETTADRELKFLMA